MTSPREYPPLMGWLTTDLACHEVQLRYASKFSLWAVFDEPVEAVTVRNLDVRVAGRLVCLGPCRTLSDEDDERVVWLTPSQVVHDLELLFSKAEVHVLGLDLSSLPLSDDYRDGIDPSFRSSLSDLTYELNGYMAHLDELDEQCREELPVVRSSIQDNLIDRTTQGFNRSLDAWNAELVRFTKSLSLVEREHYGFYFRRQVWSILVRAPFLAQTNLQTPKDWADPETQRMIQFNDHEGSSTFGKLLHKYAVGQAPSQAVRNARQECSQMLVKRLQQRDAAQEGRFKVLSVACGPALEWVEALKTPEVYQNVILSLLDQDPDVLADAASRISLAQQTLGTTLAVECIEASGQSMLETPAFAQPSQQYDFIYSLGLLDYLSDSLARSVILKLYQLLAPQGELVLVNVTSDGSTGLLEEYWKDIKPHSRSEREFLELVSPLTDADTALHYDATKLEMLLRVSKKALTETGTALES